MGNRTAIDGLSNKELSGSGKECNVTKKPGLSIKFDLKEKGAVLVVIGKCVFEQAVFVDLRAGIVPAKMLVHVALMSIR